MSRVTFLALTLLCTMPAIGASADDSRECLLNAGFVSIADPPQTAPSLPLDTQPLPKTTAIDYNNLKDPHLTPDFQPRNPVKFQLPGFSTCVVDMHGEMQIDLVKEKDAVWFHGPTPAVSGYVGRRFVDRTPTQVTATFVRADPSEGGQVMLRVADMVSGAFITLASNDSRAAAGSWSVAWSENGAWEDWKAWPVPATVDWSKPVTLEIAMTRPNTFFAKVNGAAVAGPIRLKGLDAMTECQFISQARTKGVYLLNLSAYRTATLTTQPSVQTHTVAVKKKASYTPTNPWANAVQADFPFYGVCRIADDPTLFDEMVAALKKLNIRMIRFPGGTSAYGYSIHGLESLDAMRRVSGNYELDSKNFGWMDARVYFRLCKAVGADALYQLNTGNVYDPATKKAYRVIQTDVSPAPDDQMRPDLLPAALAEAQQLARWAKEIGVKTIWEFGNEDYCYYSPKNYAEISAAFYHAIKEVDPQAQFSPCGDGPTWSDWAWPKQVLAELSARGAKDLAFTSHHVYLFGGTGIPFVDGESTFNGMLAAWANIRNMHTNVGIRDTLDKLGYTKTRLAITEGNVSVVGPLTGSALEHSMGRSLAEAAIFPARAKMYATIVHHDLARNGPENGTWFARVFYFPNNPKGSRYVLPLDAQIMGIMGRHALREIVYDGNQLAVSQDTDGLFVTCCNGLPIGKTVRVALTGITLAEGQTVTASAFVSDSLGSDQATTTTVPVTLGSDRRSLTFTAPPRSFVYFDVK